MTVSMPFSRERQRAAHERERREIYKRVSQNGAYQLWLNGIAIQKLDSQPRGWLKAMRNSRGTEVPTLAEICVLATEVLHWDPHQEGGVADPRHKEFRDTFQKFFGNGYRLRKRHMGSEAHTALNYIERNWKAALHEDSQVQLKDLNRLRDIEGHSYHCRILQVSGHLIHRLLEGSKSNPPKCLLSRRCRLSRPPEIEDPYHRFSDKALSTEISKLRSEMRRTLPSPSQPSESLSGTSIPLTNDTLALTGYMVERSRNARSSRPIALKHQSGNVGHFSNGRSKTSTVHVPAGVSIASTGAPIAQKRLSTDSAPSVPQQSSEKRQRRKPRADLRDKASVGTTGVLRTPVGAQFTVRTGSTYRASSARSSATNGIGSPAVGPAGPIPSRSSSRGKTSVEIDKRVADQDPRREKSQPRSEPSRGSYRRSSVQPASSSGTKHYTSMARQPRTSSLTATRVVGPGVYDTRRLSASRDLPRLDSPTTGSGPYKARTRRHRRTPGPRDVPRPDSPTLSPLLSPTSPTMSAPMSVAPSIRSTDEHRASSNASQQHGLQIRRDDALILRPVSSLVSLQPSHGSSAGEDPLSHIGYEKMRDHHFPDPWGRPPPSRGASVTSSRKH